MVGVSQNGEAIVPSSSQFCAFRELLLEEDSVSRVTPKKRVCIVSKEIRKRNPDLRVKICHL